MGLVYTNEFKYQKNSFVLFWKMARLEFILLPSLISKNLKVLLILGFIFINIF